MSESKDFDFDTMMDKLSNTIEDMLGDLMNVSNESIENSVMNALQDALPEALSESLSDFEFVLTDGTVVRPRQHMKLFSPDKSKLLLCYGGLRVDGCSLTVQTRICRWETIAVYQNREDAIAALLKVKNAMDAGALSFEL